MSENNEMFCPHCGNVGEGVIGGSLFITILLLIFWIIPGLIYEAWRTSEKQLECAYCGHKGLIPSDSPVAKRSLSLLENNGGDQGHTQEYIDAIEFDK